MFRIYSHFMQRTMKCDPVQIRPVLTVLMIICYPEQLQCNIFTITIILEKDSPDSKGFIIRKQAFHWTQVVSVIRTSVSVFVYMAQNVFPLLQDLLQSRLQFAGQDAVFIVQLSHIEGPVNSSHKMPFNNKSKLIVI